MDFYGVMFNMVSIFLREPFIRRACSRELQLCHHSVQRPGTLRLLVSTSSAPRLVLKPLTSFRPSSNGFKSKFEFPLRLNQTTCLSA